MSLAAAFPLAMAAQSSSQVTVIPVVDASHSGSPLMISGSITATDNPSEQLRYSFKKDISVTNVSDKEVLLWVIKMDITGANEIDIQETREQEYFFSSNLFSPNSVEMVAESPERCGRPGPPTDARAPKPKAIAAVAFVQFLDGSTWGNPAQSEHALRERRFAHSKLRALAETYRDGGQQQFVSELTQPSQLLEIEILQRLYVSNGKDVRGVIERLGIILQSAEVHGHLIRPQD